MNASSDMVEIIIFAGLAAFIGWRLVSVLGKRTGHEPVNQGDRDSFGMPLSVVQPGGTRGDKPAVMTTWDAQGLGLPDDVLTPLRAIGEADPFFTPMAFLDGAKTAYKQILQKFWASDESGLKALVSDDIFLIFKNHIKGRNGIIETRLVSIDQSDIISAHKEGAMAEITVRFVSKTSHGASADTATVTDEWTFNRHLQSNDPNWLLIATDAAGDGDAVIAG